MAHGIKEWRTTRRHERLHKVMLEEPLVYLFSFSKHLQDLPLLPHLFDLLQSPEPLLKQCNRRAFCNCFIVLPFHASINWFRNWHCFLGASLMAGGGWPSIYRWQIVSSSSHLLHVSFALGLWELICEMQSPREQGLLSISMELGLVTGKKRTSQRGTGFGGKSKDRWI